MKSIKHSSKQSKQQPKTDNSQRQPNPNSADEPTIQQSAQHQPVLNPDELTQQQQNEDAIADTAVNPEQASKSQKASKPYTQKPESSERFQHVKFLDCDKPVSRIIFECWHCFQGILCEYTGEPAIGEYKGRPSIIQIPVQCPNCEKTAIRLNTGEVLSTTAIPSPWEQ